MVGAVLFVEIVNHIPDAHLIMPRETYIILILFLKRSHIMDIKDILEKCDHTLLRVDCTGEEIRKLCTWLEA